MPTIFPVDLSTAKFAAVKPSMPLSVGSTFSLMAATASSILPASPSIVLIRAYIAIVHPFLVAQANPSTYKRDSQGASWAEASRRHHREVGSGAGRGCKRSSKLICNIPPDADESYRIDPSNIRG